ncbi:MAG: ABC transporter ATP-binding protein/permease [Desulfobacterales bacterium]|nr:ABC transporter ATP-binding protein/permease [Desulfobacterales bacterium]
MSEEKEIKLANGIVFKVLWPHIRPYAWMLILSTLLVFVGIAFELSLPLLTQKAFDGFILPVGDKIGIWLPGLNGIFEGWFPNVWVSSFTTFGLIYLSMIVAAFLVEFTQTLFMEYTGQKIILNLRCTLFSHMTGLPVSYYDENASGRLVARVAGDIENMNEMFTSVLVFIFKDLVLMAGILGVLFSMNTELAGYQAALVPVIFLGIFIFSKVVRGAFRTIRQKIGEINHSFSEGIGGIKVIQTTTSHGPFVERFKQLNFEHFKATMFQIKIFGIFMPFIGFVGTISVALVIWFGSNAVMESRMSLGALVAFLSYMKLFFRPLRELSEKFNLLQNALASAERITTVLSREPAAQLHGPGPGASTEGQTNSTPGRLHRIQELEFDRVNFSYDGKTPVLQEISLSLESGKSIGIAGPTGSGKTSIINLITGFYHPDQGEIRFNGTAMDQIPIRAIRRRCALVMQDPILFSGTLRENIKPKGWEMEDTVLEAALEKANCGFLFDKFQGLDTEIAEGGRPLSSGEKQLVCIARAFAFDPDLIIFDEATSYMDSQSELAVHDAMNKLMEGRLSIIIAHRLSTIRHCHEILLLRDGKIRESGSHADLVELKGEYYHLLKKENI